MNAPSPSNGFAPPDAPADVEARVASLLARMTLEEKIGQVQQVDAGGEAVVERLRAEIVDQGVGAIINQTDPATLDALQRIAVEETRLGIPLLVARDVIHGFRTVFPIPLGQAASWNPALAKEAARLSADEAMASGVRWTYSPMIDIARDPRWGRIAEGYGEDPYLTALFGVAVIQGYQGEGGLGPGSLAACAKHFCGYGASEAGRDYNTTNIPENELRNVYLPPFEAAAAAGVASFMTSFSDLDGIPATASRFLLGEVLRGEWGYDGLVVSDWNAIRELCVHGLCEGDADAACEAATAGVDMEMAGGAYRTSLKALVASGAVSAERLDAMVAHVLRLKVRLGLFEAPYVGSGRGASGPEALASCARTLARESLVLLQNTNDALPLRAGPMKVAVVGPLADAPAEQLGTWVFDGDPSLSVTPLRALQSRKDISVRFAPGLATSRDRSDALFEEAVAAAKESDFVIACLGEEAILSGEAHCRAQIDLPGAQVALLDRLAGAGKPVIAVIMAGRPLALGPVLTRADAVLYAWHPGTMAGPALMDVLFGEHGPVGRLPVTFPKSSGQIPIYYNHKRTGRPPVAEDVVLIDDIEVGAKQTSLGMTAFHLDEGFEPLFPFGFGLGYGRIAYEAPQVSRSEFGPGETIEISAIVRNVGGREMVETVQLYICDPVASLTRPVRELKGFQRVVLKPGEAQRVVFTIDEGTLAFSRRDRRFAAEPGRFLAWIAPNAQAGEAVAFRLKGA